VSNLRPIDAIIIHCPDSPDDRTSVNASEIRRWHLERGFKDIGYHFVICKDGTVEKGRNLNTIGAHCRGHNLFSVGICWVGRHDLNADQRAALVKQCANILKQFKLDSAAVHGHRDFEDGKTCPNIEDMDALREEIKEALNEIAS
jgi:N-acetylmuramoyl-L-alanine amidase